MVRSETAVRPIRTERGRGAFGKSRRIDQIMLRIHEHIISAAECSKIFGGFVPKTSSTNLSIEIQAGTV
jgi:hypothetical protein